MRRIRYPRGAHFLHISRILRNKYTDLWCLRSVVLVGFGQADD
jgi:hypothetical protein